MIDGWMDGWIEKCLMSPWFHCRAQPSNKNRIEISRGVLTEGMEEGESWKVGDKDKVFEDLVR